MKRVYIRILAFVLGTISILLILTGIIGVVDSAGPYVQITPAKANITTRNNYAVTVGVNASGSKICVVEGTLDFSNITCRGITPATGVIVESTPTCANPHFIIGIPHCTTTNTTLLKLTISSQVEGSGTIKLSKVDVIGEGVTVSSDSIGAKYTIKSGNNSTSQVNTVAEPTPLFDIALDSAITQMSSFPLLLITGGVVLMVFVLLMLFTKYFDIKVKLKK